MVLKKNGKKVVKIPKNIWNIKELLVFLMDEGAGLPFSEEQTSEGKWTKTLLLDKLNSQRSSNKPLDMRSIQAWLQPSNYKGVGSENREALANIFGCNDQELTRQIRLELQRANEQLAETRRKQKFDPKKPPWLSLWIDGLFTKGTRKELPVFVFVFCVLICFMAYVFGLHDITYSPLPDMEKQIGFFWAPNWVLTGLFLLPMYLIISSELMHFWKTTGRVQANNDTDTVSSESQWNTELSKYQFILWIIIFVCFLFIFLFQWIGIYLSTLITRDPDGHIIDWSIIAIYRPDVLHVAQSIFMTFWSYIHTSVNSFLYFVGLMMIYVVSVDFEKILNIREMDGHVANRKQILYVRNRLKRLICGAIVLGVVIINCIKLQAVYLLSDSENIITWLFNDAMRLSGLVEGDTIWFEQSSLANFTSFCLLLMTIVVYVYCQRMLNNGVKSFDIEDTSGWIAIDWILPNVTITVLAATYFLIGNFTGFSVVLIIGLILSGFIVYRTFEKKHG